MPVFKKVKRAKNTADEIGKPIIHSAEWADAASTVVLLSVTLPGSMEAQQPYVLNATDPYGSSPQLRAELDRMVDAGEIVIGPYVAPPPSVLEDWTEEDPAKQGA